MNLRPLHDNIVIEIDPPKSASSILAVSGDAASTGTIVAVGPKVIELAIGMRVHFGDRKPVAINNKQTNYVIIAENDIFAVLQE